jgi:hypothetical protein
LSRSFAVGHVDPDDLRVPRFDDAAEADPLAVVVGPLEREETVVVEPSDREVLDAFVAASIEEDENRAAARRIGGHRRHRREHRVVVVLARHDDPHVDPLAAHEGRQQRLEPLLDPSQLQRRLLAVREHARRRSGLRSGAGRPQQQADEESREPSHRRAS